MSRLRATAGLGITQAGVGERRPGPLLQVVQKVVEGVEAEGWIDELVVGAAKHNPGNLQLGRLVDLRE